MGEALIKDFKDTVLVSVMTQSLSCLNVDIVSHPKEYPLSDRYRDTGVDFTVLDASYSMMLLQVELFSVEITLL